jgi:hypothetical protein
VKVAGLNGVVVDSIPVRGLLHRAGVIGATGGGWILVNTYEAPNSAIVALRRDGTVGGRLALGSVTAISKVTAAALFMHLFVPGTGRPPIVRVAFDTSTGAFAPRFDTLYTGMVTRFDATRDGGALVVDEGTAEYSVWVADTRELLRGNLPEAASLARSTGNVTANVSPDGKLALVRRFTDQRLESQLTVVPAGGGPETAIPLIGPRLLSFWSDTNTVALGERVTGGVQLSLAPIRGGPRRNVLLVQDSIVEDAAVLGTGWAWIPSSQRNLVARMPGDSAPRAVPVPPWFISIFQITSAGDNRHIAVLGWDVVTNDTLGVYVIDVADGSALRWGAAFGEDGVIQ